MPTIHVSDSQYAALRDLADALVCQERYATRKPVFYQIRYETEETLIIADRCFHRNEEAAAKQYLVTHLFSAVYHDALSGLYTFDEFADFGPAHGIPVVHQTPTYRYYGCWLTHLGALAYLEQHASKFRHPDVYVNHSADPIFEGLLTWVESLTTIPDA